MNEELRHQRCDFKELKGELKQRRRGRKRERQNSNRFILGKQQLGTCITSFCTFPCRHCTTTTWKCLISRFVEDGNTRQHFSFSFPELWYSSANSLFKRRFRSRSRRRGCCLSSLIWISRRPRYFRGKHISIVEIVTVMRINASFFKTPPIY